MGQRTRVQLPATWKSLKTERHSPGLALPLGLVFNSFRESNRGKTQAEKVFRKTRLPFPVPT